MAETYNDINLKSLVFNKVTNEEYRQMVQNGTIKDDEFYITPSELIDVPNIDSTTSGKYLSNDGTGALWSDVQSTNIVQDLSNPSANTVLSSQGVANESSRIVSIMDTKVNKSGDTMTGNLSITGDGWNLYMQSNSILYNTAPSSWLGKTIGFTDKNGASIGVVEVAKHPGNTNDIYFNVFGPKGSWCPITLGLRANSDGSFGSTAPKCNWDNSIVTTISHGSGFMRFGNGLQICFGNSAVNQTITFTQPFKNNAYRVAFCQTDPSSHTYNNIATSKTTTSFKFSSGYTGDWIAIGYWY